MSWFSEFAGKAEDLLNKMDQKAAVVLKETSKSKSNASKYEHLNTTDRSFDTTQPFRTQTTAADTVLGSGVHSRNSSISSSFSTISSRELLSTNSSNSHGYHANKSGKDSGSVKDEDEKLFEFLNAKECTANASTSRSNTPTKASTGEEELRGSDEEKSEIIASAESASDELESDHKSNSKVMSEEIVSLKKELAKLTKRNVELETECKRLKKRLENWKNQIGSSDAALRELQSRESDLRAEIDAKNSQLAVLRVRLQETDEQLKVKQATIEALEAENRALIDEQRANSSQIDENMEGLRSRLKELEEELIQEKELLRETQTESMKQLGKYEDKQGQLVDEISNLQRSLSREKANYKDIEKRFKQLESNYSCLETEFSEYKLRAQKTLQSKDELIKALQESKGVEENSLQTESNKFNKVLESQCDAMVIEIQELRQRNDHLKKELDRVLNEEVFSLNSQIIALNEEREEERNNKRELEQDLKQCQEEVRYLHDELNQTRANLNQRIKDREQEIEKLRKQLVSKRSSSSSGASIEDLEARVKTLTDNLIEKQTLVEQLSSERHSLVLQLERTEERLREALETASFNSMYSSPGSVSIGMVHSSSASNLVNRIRPFVEENPSDNQVTRGVKRAYGQIDRFR
ncbi:Golgin subfamily A member 5-like protein [Dinothrombium tinctorium]|uniref:Golgin subfamily A member 5-like protein n=1 Tax=Dinothrombium tinctorium TaxID=1965070 RepID=A0A3S3P531_9ACAR|nr:Golgin subfamily A member 5-like protein [Dinothrombium tinctorium]RWS01080.1 Golgin subfamily A member 5-like protein [Dinothrombium tinctorium]RWS01137.1 Golgin subfamily A member 5-like protein [Dinothrombium tinctorium]RWS01148.1 Golgin subfamily A member 5-like protein [Dinothrombium tinctorium]